MARPNPGAVMTAANRPRPSIQLVPTSARIGTPTTATAASATSAVATPAVGDRT